MIIILYLHIIVLIYFKLIAEVLLLATASVSGLYYRIMSDAAHNRTVDGTRTGIEQRVKLECEREQQEQLLLSVIPAYIAAEVSFLFFILPSNSVFFVFFASYTMLH